MVDRDSTETLLAAADEARVLSRRQALTAAAALAAAGAPPAATAGPSDGPSGANIGITPSPANSVEFRAHFTQTGSTGEQFEAVGYLTRVAGASDADLYAGTSLSESTALFTAYAQGALTNRVHDATGVHTLDIDGTLTVYQRAAPGATFTDPSSFRAGTPVAQFDITLQDVLTVFAPGQGLPSLNGAMRQKSAERLAGFPPGRRFGRVGSQARLSASGIGTLIDPATLNSKLDMGGNWVVV